MNRRRITQEEANRTNPCPATLAGYERIDGGGAPVPVRCTRPLDHDGLHADQYNGNPIEWSDDLTVIRHDQGPKPYRPSLPVIDLELHQRTALDHVRDTQTLTLVAYADNTLHLDEPGEHVTAIAKVVVDRPYIYAGSQQEWRNEVLRHAERKALEMGIPTVWEGRYGGIFGKWKDA